LPFIALTTTGDGLLAEFASVVDAVRCAIELQRQMALRNDDVPSERRIQFRIGINVGDIIIEADDIYGDCANFAARLEALAAPGGICISAIVHDQVQGRLECAFADLGEQSLKKNYPADPSLSRRTANSAGGEAGYCQRSAGAAGQAVDRDAPVPNISGATSSRGRSEKAAGGCASPRN
jgi:adenylate cyclase